MVTFFGIHQDQKIVTQIVPVGMIGTKMMMNRSGEENQKRNYLKLCVHTTNINHLIILHHHQLHYPSTKKN